MSGPGVPGTPAIVGWVAVFAAVFLWSGIGPADYPTWGLEVFPAVAALVAMAVTLRRFPLTSLSYQLILVHAIILMIGGHYTYAEVPLGQWVADWLDQPRNDYDKLGHLAQGFVPAIVIREVMVRLKIVNGRGWLAFVVVAACLAFSAFYELIEWWVALLSREAAESFLGTQGYVWDTQSDMAWALFGAMLALVTLSRLHDRQMSA